MIGSLRRLVEGFDRLSETATPLLGQRIGRRSGLPALGTAIAGTAILPMLPFDRSGSGAQAANTRDEGDETCEYWRYCALDGFLCTCCGGSLASCPPSAEPSKVTWVGTCQNPKANKAYLISYNDCCGQVSCGN